MKVVTVGEVASAAGSAYVSYEGGLGDSSNQALFAAAVAGGASALAIAQNGQPFLNGLGMGCRKYYSAGYQYCKLNECANAI